MPYYMIRLELSVSKFITECKIPMQLRQHKWIIDQKHNLLLQQRRDCNTARQLPKLTKPIADQIIFSSIYEHFDTILKKRRNTHFQVPHPICEHGLVHSLTTGDKFYIPNSKGIPNRLLLEKIFHVWEIITKTPFTLLSDVIILQKLIAQRKKNIKYNQPN